MVGSMPELHRSPFEHGSKHFWQVCDWYGVTHPGAPHWQVYLPHWPTRMVQRLPALLLDKHGSPALHGFSHVAQVLAPRAAIHPGALQLHVYCPHRPPTWSIHALPALPFAKHGSLELQVLSHLVQDRASGAGRKPKPPHWQVYMPHVPEPPTTGTHLFKGSRAVPQRFKAKSSQGDTHRSQVCERRPGSQPGALH